MHLFCSVINILMKLHWAAHLIHSFNVLFFMRSWTVSCFMLLSVHSQCAVWYMCGLSVYIPELFGCQSQRSQRGGVRITLLYTCGWMNYWKHPAWRGIQLTSVQLVEVCMSIWASTCISLWMCMCLHVCLYVHMCVFCTGFIICFSVCVWGGSPWQERQLCPAVGHPMQWEGVCIDIRVE